MAILRQSQITEMIITEICLVKNLNKNGVQSLVSDIEVLRKHFLGENGYLKILSVLNFLETGDLNQCIINMKIEQSR